MDDEHVISKVVVTVLLIALLIMFYFFLRFLPLDGVVYFIIIGFGPILVLTGIGAGWLVPLIRAGGKSIIHILALLLITVCIVAYGSEAIKIRSSQGNAKIERETALRQENCIARAAPSADLSRCDLQSADLQGVNLAGANLNNANLKGANLANATLTSVTLLEANLENAILEGANLEEANLAGANLTRANLRNANLQGISTWGQKPDGGYSESGVTLQGADLSGARLDNASIDADFRDIVGLTLEMINSVIRWTVPESITRETVVKGKELLRPHPIHRCGFASY